MILRRMREHVTRHNWFAVLVDFIIVVVGVFLGIQASNWNQARETRAQAREYRGMLVSDLTSNVANLEMRHRYYVWVKKEALTTLAALHRPSSELGEQFLIDAYQTSQMQPWVLKRTTYDQIVSVGAMNELGSALLRDKVANYYVATDVAGFNVSSLPPYREILRRIMPYPVQERIRSRCNEKGFPLRPARATSSFRDRAPSASTMRRFVRPSSESTTGLTWTSTSIAGLSTWTRSS